MDRFKWQRLEVLIIINLLVRIKSFIMVNIKMVIRLVYGIFYIKVKTLITKSCKIHLFI